MADVLGVQHDLLHSVPGHPDHVHEQLPGRRLNVTATEVHGGASEVRREQRDHSLVTLVLGTMPHAFDLDTHGSS